MKKLVALMSVLALGAVSAMAQGSIIFDSGSTFPILVATGTDSASLSNATKVGSNATSVSLGAGPTNVLVALFVQTNGVAVTVDPVTHLPQNMFLAGVTSNSPSALASFQGRFIGYNPYTLGTVGNNVLGAFNLAALATFDGSSPIEYMYYAVTKNGNFSGNSALGTGYSLGTGPLSSIQPTFGVGPGQIPTGWTMTPSAVPEPSTIALGGLGVASLLLFRRKK